MVLEPLPPDSMALVSTVLPEYPVLPKTWLRMVLAVVTTLVTAEDPPGKGAKKTSNGRIMPVKTQ